MNLTFKAWYKSLTGLDKKTTKAKICEVCCLRGNTIFNNWLYDYTGIAPIYQPFIDKIAGQSLDYTFTPRPSSYHSKKNNIHEN